MHLCLWSQVLCEQTRERTVEGEFLGQGRSPIERLGVVSGGLLWASHCAPAQAWAHPLYSTHAFYEALPTCPLPPEVCL